MSCTTPKRTPHKESRRCYSRDGPRAPERITLFGAPEPKTAYMQRHLIGARSVRSTLAMLGICCPVRSSTQASHWQCLAYAARSALQLMPTAMEEYMAVVSAHHFGFISRKLFPNSSSGTVCCPIRSSTQASHLQCLAYAARSAFRRKHRTGNAWHMLPEPLFNSCP